MKNLLEFLIGRSRGPSDLIRDAIAHVKIFKVAVIFHNGDVRLLGSPSSVHQRGDEGEEGGIAPTSPPATCAQWNERGELRRDCCTPSSGFAGVVGGRQPH